jgi:RecB family endonuclease NucS
MYADCHVIYEGRAFSQLARGRYLIIYKPDKSLMIHNNRKSPPVNYQNFGSILTIDNNVITSTRKKETIRIFLHQIIEYNELEDWSDAIAVVRCTEKDLVNQIHDNYKKYLPIEDLELIKEYPTDHGPVDLVGIDKSNTYYIIEVKRVKGALSHCSQLKRYVDSVKIKKDVEVKGFLACPTIGKNALAYLTSMGFAWLEVNHDSVIPI